jgi:hypothetical protein
VSQELELFLRCCEEERVLAIRVRPRSGVGVCQKFCFDRLSLIHPAHEGGDRRP